MTRILILVALFASCHGLSRHSKHVKEFLRPALGIVKDLEEEIVDGLEMKELRSEASMYDLYVRNDWFAMFDAGGAMCGGSLIEHDIVVTAAHCVDLPLSTKDRKKLGSGWRKGLTEEQVATVSSTRRILTQGFVRIGEMISKTDETEQRYSELLETALETHAETFSEAISRLGKRPKQKEEPKSWWATLTNQEKPKTKYEKYMAEWNRLWMAMWNKVYTDLASEGVYMVRELAIHPGYRTMEGSSVSRADVALLKLSQPAQEWSLDLSVTLTDMATPTTVAEDVEQRIVNAVERTISVTVEIPRNKLTVQLMDGIGETMSFRVTVRSPSKTKMDALVKSFGPENSRELDRFVLADKFAREGFHVHVKAKGSMAKNKAPGRENVKIIPTSGKVLRELSSQTRVYLDQLPKSSDSVDLRRTCFHPMYARWSHADKVNNLMIWHSAKFQSLDADKNAVAMKTAMLSTMTSEIYWMMDQDERRSFIFEFLEETGEKARLLAANAEKSVAAVNRALQSQDETWITEFQEFKASQADVYECLMDDQASSPDNPRCQHMVVGYGLTKNKGEVSHEPKMAFVQVQQSGVCMMDNEFVWEQNTMMCVKRHPTSPMSGNSCQGDSGGPLIAKFPELSKLSIRMDLYTKDSVLMGAVSFGGNCDSKEGTSVYAKLGAPVIANWMAELTKFTPLQKSRRDLPDAAGEDITQLYTSKQYNQEAQSWCNENRQAQSNNAYLKTYCSFIPDNNSNWSFSNEKGMAETVLSLSRTVAAYQIAEQTNFKKEILISAERAFNEFYQGRKKLVVGKKPTTSIFNLAG